MAAQRAAEHPRSPPRRTPSASVRKEVRVTDPSPEARLVEEFCGFLAKEHGCVLKAWRRVLDPSCMGQLRFGDFAEALTRVAWHGDTSALWRALLKQDCRPQGHTSVGLFELSPEDDTCCSGFRRWAACAFGGAVDMFQQLTEGSASPSMSYEAFSRACDAHGFQGSKRKVFHEALDIDGLGEISIKDMAFLEQDTFKRRVATDMSFNMGLASAKAQQKIVRRRTRRMQLAQESAVNMFRQRVRAEAGGSFIRGWRRFMDHSGNLCVSKVSLLKGCRKVAFAGDSVALWKGLDLDDSGAIELHEVEPGLALALARFKRWAVPKLGGCTEAVQKLGESMGLGQRGAALKLSVDDLAASLRSSGFPGVPGLPDRAAAALLHEAFDLRGVGSINGQDAAFLERWDPAPWLWTDPDEVQKDHFISLLRQRYGSLLVAWRRIDGRVSNRVSYKEFTDACKAHRFQSLNVTGIWAALDTQISGFISLRDLDKESADVLMRFKDWAEGVFGNLQFAFKVMDEKKANALSYARFRKALQDYGYRGDAKVLFESLKPGGGDQRRRDVRLTLEDLMYLSSLRTDLAGFGEPGNGRFSRRGSRSSRRPSVQPGCAHTQESFADGCAARMFFGAVGSPGGSSEAWHPRPQQGLQESGPTLQMTTTWSETMAPEVPVASARGLPALAARSAPDLGRLVRRRAPCKYVAPQRRRGPAGSEDLAGELPGLRPHGGLARAMRASLSPYKGARAASGRLPVLPGPLEGRPLPPVGAAAAAQAQGDHES